MASAIIELHGHLIDSLLLAKVIDRIQLSGYDYEVTDLRIGPNKPDISTAQIKLSAPSDEDLQMLLDELKIHGARQIAEEEVQSLPAPAAGVAPEGAWLRHMPPTEVLWLGAWSRVETPEYEAVIVLTQTGPRLTPLPQVNQGDLVVVGFRGIRSLREAER
jgi:hypothetical protein